MGRIRDTLDDASAILMLVVAVKFLSGFEWPSLEQIQAENREKFRKARGGKGAGAGSTYGTGAGNGQVWSEATMQVFAAEMQAIPVDPWIVLKGIAAASNFNADEHLGGTTGLLLVEREDLSALGYPGVPLFEEIDAPAQIPWIARVIAYRIANMGGDAPTNVGQLALLLHTVANDNIAQALYAEAERRSAAVESNALYIEHANLLRHVLAGSPPRQPPGWGP